jgi:hypothetical protein
LAGWDARSTVVFASPPDGYSQRSIHSREHTTGGLADSPFRPKRIRVKPPERACVGYIRIIKFGSEAEEDKSRKRGEKAKSVATPSIFRC